MRTIEQLNNPHSHKPISKRQKYHSLQVIEIVKSMMNMVLLSCRQKLEYKSI